MLTKRTSALPTSLVLAALLVAVGCSSDDDDDATTPDDPSTDAGDDPIADPDPSTVPGDDPDAGSTLRLENRDAVLADVLRVLNAEPIDETLAALPDLISSTADLPDGITRLSVVDDVMETPPEVPKPIVVEDAFQQDEPSAFRRTDYRCETDGTATVLFDQALADSPFTDAFTLHGGCSVDGTTFDGATRTRVFSRPFVEGTGAAALSVTTPDGVVRTLDGVVESGQSSRVTPSEFVTLREVRYSEAQAGGTLEVDSYGTNLEVDIDDFPAGDVTEAVLPDGSTAEFYEVTLDVSFSGGFEIEAPWSGGAPAQVTVELGGADSFWRWPDWTEEASNEVYGDLVAPDGTALAFDVEPDERFAWKSGTLTITAADGSTLVIEPTDGAPAGLDAPAFAVSSGDERTVVTQDTLRIDCAERVANACRIGGTDR